VNNLNSEDISFDEDESQHTGIYLDSDEELTITTKDANSGSENSVDDKKGGTILKSSVVVEPDQGISVVFFDRHLLLLRTARQLTIKHLSLLKVRTQTPKK